MNMQALLKQAQKMQKDMAAMENQLSERIYDATIGGGVIKISVRGNLTVDSIDIDQTLLEKENKEDIQEMLVSVLNEALIKAAADKEESMNAITGGIKMPGGF